MKKISKTTKKPKSKSASKSVKKSQPPVLQVKKAVIHYTAGYLLDPMHPVTVNVIGCGGTGSQVLNSLARMNSALKALNHPGLFVRAIDPDRVSLANMGRQLFSPSDVDAHKCTALIGRINRFFGTDWESVPSMFTATASIPSANITISCVDSGKARKEIKAILRNSVTEADQPFHRPYYWLDFGNMADRGQVVLGTLVNITQPKSEEFECRSTLPTIEKLHPDIFIDRKGDDQGPSCSLAEALQKQDLFINTNLANMGLGILWKLFREARLKVHGCYLNLDNLSVNAIKIV